MVSIEDYSKLLRDKAVVAPDRGLSIELSADYHRDAVSYCRAAEDKVSMPTLFDFLNQESAA